MFTDEFDDQIVEVIEKAVRRFTDKENKRPLSSANYWMTVHVTKRGRIRLGFWRDNVDYYRPALTFDLGALLVEQLGYESEEDDWSFDPWRKALKRLLHRIDAKERECRKQYKLEQAGKGDTDGK